VQSPRQGYSRQVLRGQSDCFTSTFHHTPGQSQSLDGLGQAPPGRLLTPLQVAQLRECSLLLLGQRGEGVGEGDLHPAVVWRCSAIFALACRTSASSAGFSPFPSRILWKLSPMFDQ